MDSLLAVLQPTIEACCKALLNHDASVVTTRELRELLRKLDGLLRTETKTDQERAVEAMLLIRKVIDRAVGTSPLAFLNDPLSRTLGRSHEGCKTFIKFGPETLPRTSPVRYLRPD
jgi:hypothetical protein